MTSDLQGNTSLARLAQQLPVRARIGVAVVAAYLILDGLRDLPDHACARDAFDLVRRWFDGERFNPDRFEDAIHSERHEGLDSCAQHAQSEDERACWLVLGNVLAYTAFHAYQAIGKDPSPGVSEVDEGILDEIDTLLRALSPHFIRVVVEAAKYLKGNDAASFAELSTRLGPPPVVDR